MKLVCPHGERWLERELDEEGKRERIELPLLHDCMYVEAIAKLIPRAVAMADNAANPLDPWQWNLAFHAAMEKMASMARLRATKEQVDEAARMRTARNNGAGPCRFKVVR